MVQISEAMCDNFKTEIPRQKQSTLGIIILKIQVFHDVKQS